MLIAEFEMVVAQFNMLIFNFNFLETRILLPLDRD